MLESPAWDISTNCKHLKIMSHIVNMLDLTQTENNMEVELIQENGNETSEQSQHFWPMHSMPPPTTFIPPPLCKKITMCEKPLSKQIVDQRLAKGFLQNKQIGRVNKKNWEEEIACIRNLLLC